MKSLICSAGMLCLSATPLCLRAQDANLEKEKVHSPKLELGLQTGLYKSFGNAHQPVYHNTPANLNSINTGIFARYYFGKHFAVESGINVSTSAINPPRGTDMYINYGSFQRTVNSRSYEIPVQLQYHLLSPESKIRPYFGIGASRISHNYHINDRFYEATGELAHNVSRNETVPTLAVKFTQGVTWQINKNWQLNQSLYFQRELAGHKNNIGLQLGVGYTIK